MSSQEDTLATQPRIRSKTVLCTCRSHCTVYNPITREYDGRGVIQARSTRDNHRLDDQRLARSGGSSSGPFRKHLSRSAGERSVVVQSTSLAPRASSNSETSNWLGIITQEIDIISDFPVTNPTHPLVFVNIPQYNGEFTQSSDLELIRPNTGLHRLQSSIGANRAFLDTEG